MATTAQGIADYASGFEKIIQPYIQDNVPEQTKLLKVLKTNDNVEVFNNALGITTVVIPGSVGFATTTQFGLMGITALQTVRLNVAATGTQPCFENFSWTMGDGTPVGPSGSFGLAPGKVGSVDQAGSSLVTGFAERVLVRPVLTPVPGPNGTPSGSCVASMEVTSTAPAPPWFIGLRIHATQHAPSARSSKLRQAWPA